MPAELPAVNDHDLEQLTSMFRLLTDKTRLNILLILAEGERNVSSLCAQLNLPQPTVSHHLGLLRMSNVIGNRREGKQVFYGLNGCIDAVAASLNIAVHNYEVRIDRRANASATDTDNATLDAMGNIAQTVPV
jgi:DNA-binding transcriptional ArsR family regulator